MGATIICQYRSTDYYRPARLLPSVEAYNGVNHHFTVSYVAIKSMQTTLCYIFSACKTLYATHSSYSVLITHIVKSCYARWENTFQLPCSFGPHHT